MLEVPSSDTANTSMKRKPRPFLKGLLVGVISTAILGAGITGLYIAQEQEVSMREEISAEAMNPFVTSGVQSTPAFQRLIENDVFETEAWKEYVSFKNSLYEEENRKQHASNQEMKAYVPFPDLRERLDHAAEVVPLPHPVIGLNDPFAEHMLFLDLAHTCGAKIVAHGDGSELRAEREDSPDYAGLFSSYHGESVTPEESKQQNEVLKHVIEAAQTDYCT